MPEATITYKKPETLKILKGLAKYLDFKIDSNKKKTSFDDSLIRGDKTLSVAELEDVNIIPGDKSIDISEMEELFSGKGLEAKELRKKAWQRTK